MDYNKIKIEKVTYYSEDGRSKGSQFILEPFPTLDEILRNYDSRNAKYVIVNILGDKADYYYRVEKSHYCTSQDDCQDDNCRCYDFIHIQTLAGTPTMG